MCCRGICACSSSSATWRRGLLLAIGFVAVVSFVKLWRGFLVVSHSRSDSSNRGKTFVQRTWDVAFGGGLAAKPDAESARRRFLFVGGLQRSGTTAVSKLLGSLPFTSKLTMTEGQMAQNKPWRVQNMTMEYFYDVVSEGDVEGKFIQDVYPYKYILDIVGRSSSEGAHGGSIAEIVRRETLGYDYKPAAAAAEGRLQMGPTLLSQWEPYWNMSKAVLVEKTPENVLMAPFLERLFGEELAEPVFFLFTLRHPVAWALAVEKWISGALRYDVE